MDQVTVPQVRKPFHVVRITEHGYSRLASYAERVEARSVVLADQLRLGGCVLRDGLTGKRYCPAELRAEYADSDDINEERRHVSE